MALSTFLLLLNGREAMDLVKLALYSVHEWSVERRLDVFERHPKNHVFVLCKIKKVTKTFRGLGAVLELWFKIKLA